MSQAEHNPALTPAMCGGAARPEAGGLADDLLRPITQQFTARLQAHTDHLTAHQRASGVRIRLCSSGCYAVYNAEGNFIARTPPPGTLTGLPAAALKTSAARMAYSEELVTVCRAADIDFEFSGSVSSATVAAIRALLTQVDAK